MVRNHRRRHLSTSRKRKSESSSDNVSISSESIQCCGGYMDSAETGHLQCLQGFSEAGRFLPLDSPDWTSAGESRKLEFWECRICILQGRPRTHADVAL
eukprot:jgi/Botrbrau1/13092/Bobra.0187s0051.1